jgi:hypothetical protein
MSMAYGSVYYFYHLYISYTILEIMSYIFWTDNFMILNVQLTWCGYKVPGMILLRDFNGAMKFDGSINMAVHI